MSWVSEELKHADLGDKRRNQRLVRIVEDLSSQPSVRGASRALTKVFHKQVGDALIYIFSDSLL